MSEKYTLKDFAFPLYESEKNAFKINWKFYPNFKIDTDPFIYEENYQIHFQNPNIILKNDIMDITFQEIKNPYPEIVFTTSDNQQAIIPAHRILTIDKKEDSLTLQFMPHGQNPLSNLPIHVKCMWGIAKIESSSGEIVKLFDLLNKLVYFGDSSPRPRCSYCQGLKSIGIRSKDDDPSEDIQQNLVCSDCFQILLENLKELKLYWSKIDIFIPEDENNKIYSLIESSLALTADFPEAVIEFYLVLTKALLIVKSNFEIEGEESFITILADISLFLENNPNSFLLGLKKKIQELNPENLSKSAKLETKENILIDDAIELIKKAKFYEKEGDYRLAIDAIYSAAEPLVDFGVWGEQELYIAKSEVKRLEMLIKEEEEEKEDELELPDAPIQNAQITENIQTPEKMEKMEKIEKTDMNLEIDMESEISEREELEEKDLRSSKEIDQNVQTEVVSEDLKIPTNNTPDKLSLEKVSIPKFKGFGKKQKLELDTYKKETQFNMTEERGSTETDEKTPSDEKPQIQGHKKVLNLLLEKSPKFGKDKISSNNTEPSTKPELPSISKPRFLPDEFKDKGYEVIIPPKPTVETEYEFVKFLEKNAVRNTLGSFDDSKEEEKGFQGKKEASFFFGVKKVEKKPIEGIEPEEMANRFEPTYYSTESKQKIKKKSRKSRRRVKSKNTICPMCGKLGAKNCVCGFMK
jgi:uncharacterized protein (UPF0248 family)